jgi:hypothetical protein
MITLQIIGLELVVISTGRLRALTLRGFKAFFCKSDDLESHGVL